MPRFAVIDVGTNSVKLHVGERHAGRHWTRGPDRSTATRLDDLQAPDVLVGIGGGVVTLAAVMLGLDPSDPDRVQGTVLPRPEVWRQIELHRSRPIELRRRIPGLYPPRAEIILAEACIIWTIILKLCQGSLTVRDCRLRHGVLLDRFGG
jgi:exopolyphosphatase / guanosine-5'-triphosphate,3'-diphosphate pyrophosphatase